MINFAKEVSLSLPSWTNKKVEQTLTYPTPSEKMNFVLDLLATQIECGTGFPFASTIFDKAHKVFAVGVNASSLLNNSMAHAEALALQFAQATIGKPYLPKSGEYTLATSAQPCAMCLGAIYNSGVRELIIGARESDIEEILKFSQGPIHPQWREFLAAKKIGVTEDVERDKATSLIRSYVMKSGTPGPKSVESVEKSANTPPS